MNTKKNILIVAPHADDEILGCGGTMAKFIDEGNNVYVAIMTNAHVGDPEIFSKEGIENVRIEAKNANSFLGVKQIYFFDFPAPKLDNFPSYKIANEIKNLLDTLQIDTLFIPHRGDIHKDHRIIFESALVAGRPVGNYTVKKIYAYETLSETEWAAPFGDDAFIPNFFVELSEKYVEAKSTAMKFYKSQLRNFPSTRSIETIQSLGKFRGSTINRNTAEAFMIIRDIVTL